MADTNRRQPQPHQVRALDFARPLDKCGFFLDMRLGKSTTSLWWLDEKPDAYATLIVTPNEAIEDFKQEIIKEGHSVDVVNKTDNNSIAILLDQVARHYRAKSKKFVICNKEKLFKAKGRTDARRNIDRLSFLAIYPWDAVIWDESTSLKNPKAQVTQQATLAFEHTKYKCLLSGLPTPEKMTEIFTQMVWLRGSFMGHTNFWRWRDEWFSCIGFDWVPKKGTMQIINAELAKCCIRITKADAGIKTLSEIVVKRVKPKDSWLEDYTSIQKNFGWKDTYTKFAISLATWLRQISGGIGPFPELHSTQKFWLLKKTIDEINAKHIIVLFRSNEELKRAWTHLYLGGGSGDKVLSLYCLTGEVKRAERKALLENFKNSDAPKSILLAQVKVMRFGMNLSFCDHMIRYSMPLGREDYAQSLERIVSVQDIRMKHYYDLVVAGTIDEHIVALQKDKSVDASRFMSALLERMKLRNKK